MQAIAKKTELVVLNFDNTGVAEGWMREGPENMKGLVSLFDACPRVECRSTAKGFAEHAALSRDDSRI